MEPVFTYSIINENSHGIMLLLIEFTKKCRYTTPELAAQLKSNQNQKWQADGLPNYESDILNIQENAIYFGNDNYPESPLIYIESALNILNIMASYYNNNLINYLKKDIFGGVTMIASTCCFLIEKFLSNDIMSEHTLKILTKKNIFINSYLRVLSKSLYLIYQRFEYRLGNEENVYENTELLQALIHTYSVLFNFVAESSSLKTPSNINKHLIMLNMEIIISLLSIWGELSGFTESLVLELVYRYYSSIKNRAPILYLIGTLLEMFAANDKNILHEAIKALTSPYTPKKYERKLDIKEKDHIPGQKERKPLPIFKLHHHESFFGDLLAHD